MKSGWYIIVSANTPEALERDVVTYISSGYTPIGGVAVDPYGHYVQAMMEDNLRH